MYRLFLQENCSKRREYICSPKDNCVQHCMPRQQGLRTNHPPRKNPTRMNPTLQEREGGGGKYILKSKFLTEEDSHNLFRGYMVKTRISERKMNTYKILEEHIRPNYNFQGGASFSKKFPRGASFKIIISEGYFRYYEISEGYNVKIMEFRRGQR